MLEALFIKGFADSSDAAVHHVAGADQIRTGAGLRHGLLAEDGHRFVVENHALTAHDAVVAVAGIGIKGHVGHDRHAGMHFLETADRPGDQTALVEALGAVFGFQSVRHLREQHHAADAQIPGAAYFLHQPLEAPALATGHGADGLVASPLVHEQRVDEVGRAKGGLTHHRPQSRRTAETTGAVGELHQGRRRVGKQGRILRSLAINSHPAPPSSHPQGHVPRR